MRENKHTPGPWTVRSTTGTQYDFTVADVDDFRKVTARFPSEPANALLIAAAPDLLAAAEQMQDCLFYGDDADDRLLAVAQDALIAAIAKAKGE